MTVLFDVTLDLELIHKGKVRNIYNIDDERMLIVVTDRLSAFDVVFDDPINNKGIILNKITNFWFNKTKHIVPNHLIDEDINKVLSISESKLVKGRAVVVKKLKPLAIEAVIRGYIIGSGWKDYQRTGSVCDVKLPKNLKLAAKLTKEIYTPSTKACNNSHDKNINFTQTVDIVGSEHAAQIKNISLKLYRFAAQYAIKRNIIIADTKFEFGIDNNNQLTLMDEVLTPDSSRFWSLDSYQEGVNPDSFDKQIVRDYVETLNWNKKPPAPKLPQDIIEKTIDKYRNIQNQLCN